MKRETIGEGKEKGNTVNFGDREEKSKKGSRPGYPLHTPCAMHHYSIHSTQKSMHVQTSAPPVKVGTSNV